VLTETHDGSPAPSLAVSIDRCETELPGKVIEVEWLLQNLGSEPLELEESWLPHGQFRGERQTFKPPISLAPQGTLIHIRKVDVAGAAGSVIENAFLILRVGWQGEPWRVFARIRSDIGQDGRIEPIVELVTASPVQPMP
jgi:hypothetical protein